MQVTVHYHGQLRHAAGCPQQRIDLDAGSRFTQLLGRLCDLHGESFRILTKSVSGGLHPSLLVFVDDEPADAATPLCEGAEVSILTPMAGG
jgi:molybdopterin converting factor small subunit